MAFTDEQLMQFYRRKEGGPITKEDIFRLIKTQQNKCALSSNELKWDRAGPNMYNASIDRIDNDRGYTTDNIRLVCWIVNQAQSNFPDGVFTKICTDVANTNRDRRLMVRIVECGSSDMGSIPIGLKIVLNMTLNCLLG